jgi:hypothetical protein
MHAAVCVCEAKHSVEKIEREHACEFSQEKEAGKPWQRAAVASSRSKRYVPREMRPREVFLANERGAVRNRGVHGEQVAETGPGIEVVVMEEW